MSEGTGASNSGKEMMIGHDDTATLTSPDELLRFAKRTAIHSKLRTTPMPLKEGGAWRLVDGRLRHRTGRFFEIAGISASGPSHLHVEKPLIVQREIGTLGFLLHRSRGDSQVLVNAKVEPGNVGVCQLAPSCQATLSNQQRVHGGAPTPCYEPFDSPAPTAVVSDSLQSEQGTRFWMKRNRNVVVMLNDRQRAATERPPTHAWARLDDLLSLLGKDFSLNTDARSVLVTSHWESLIGRLPFREKRQDSELADACERSFHAVVDPAPELDQTRSLLDAARRRPGPVVQRVDLTAMGGWEAVPEGFRARRGGPFDILHYAVEVENREVPAWEQPFIESRSPGTIILCCSVVGGVPRFLFRLVREVGLETGVELTPSFCSEPGVAFEDQLKGDPAGARLFDAIEARGKTWLHSRQSEEGGRFFRDVNHYRIVDLGSAPPELPGDFVWLSLRTIQHLVVRSQTFTNEARSILSFLLAHC